MGWNIQITNQTPLTVGQALQNAALPVKTVNATKLTQINNAVNFAIQMFSSTNGLTNAPNANISISIVDTGS